MLYQTQMTAFVQEPKVGEIAPGFVYPEYEKEYEKEQALIRKKMAKDTVMVRTFVEDQVSIAISLTKLFYKLYFHPIMLPFLFDIFISK
jgi:hypothetical protein